MPASRDPLTVPELSHLQAKLARWQQEIGGENGPRDPIDLVEQLLGPALCRRLGIYRLKDDFLLSVVVPVYNEAGTVEEVIKRIRSCGIRSEIILVDDASTDGTKQVLERYRGEPDIRLIFHER